MRDIRDGITTRVASWAITLLAFIVLVGLQAAFLTKVEERFDSKYVSKSLMEERLRQIDDYLQRIKRIEETINQQRVDIATIRALLERHEQQR